MTEMQTTSLGLKITEPTLAFDADSLRAWAVGLTEKYQGLIVTEDAVIDAKRDMAEINKAKKSLDDARKQAVREVSAPIKEFEAQIKGVIEIFSDTYKSLQEQVKHFEDKEREEKAVAVKELIATALAERAAEVPAFDIPVQEKWLNKTATMKSVREAIDAAIDKHIAALALEKQAKIRRDERTAFIEAKVNEVNASFGLALPVARFMTEENLSCDKVSWAVRDDILAAAQAEKAKLEQAKAKQAAEVEQAEPEQPAAPVQEQLAPAQQEQRTGTVHHIMVIASYHDCNAAQAEAAIRALRAACADFSIRRK